jgi:predicted secreted protein|tara:strand:+ start:2153 stop:2569 length:417 start_codon:yes stop_codon:yes gene_type:complete
MATNTAIYSGTQGVAKFDVGGSVTNVASIISFSVSQTGDTIETSAMGSTSRTYLPGLTNFTGSLSLYFRDDDAAQSALFAGAGAAAASIELFPSGQATGVKLSGEIIVTSHDITTANDGAVTAEVSFQGTGALTKTDL